MKRLLAVAALLACYAGQPNATAQEKSQSDIELQFEKATIEVRVEQGLPVLLQHIEKTTQHSQKNQWIAGLQALENNRRELDEWLGGLHGLPEYQELELSLRRIDLTLSEALYSLQQRRKAAALFDLSRAYRLTQSLMQSPLLKLSASKAGLSQANAEIRNKNYEAAGLLLQESIDKLSALENHPQVKTQELRSLKSALVIAHQQVILGKKIDKKYLDNLYERARVATTNALYQYYDLWSRTPAPWDRNQ